MRALRGVLPLAAACVVLAACESDTHRQISASGAGAHEVSAAAMPDGLALAWYDTRDGNAELYARLLDANGEPSSPELRLTRTIEQSYEGDIAAVGDGFAVAWYEKNAAGELRAQLGYWDRSQEQRWQIALGDEGHDSRNALVRAHGDALFAAWIEKNADAREHVRGGWWNLDGSVARAPIALGEAGTTTWNLNAAIASDGTAVVVYDAKVDTAAEELYLAELADGSTRLARISTDDGFASKYPDLALGEHGAALTWFDERDGNREIYLTVGALEALRGGAEARAQRITTTPGRSIGAYLDWNGSRIGLAWSDDSSGSYEIYAQTFAATGAAEAEPRRLTTTAAGSLIPAIRPWRAGFAIAWSEVERAGTPDHDSDSRAEVFVAFIP